MMLLNARFAAKTVLVFGMIILTRKAFISPLENKFGKLGINSIKIFIET